MNIVYIYIYILLIPISSNHFSASVPDTLLFHGFQQTLQVKKKGTKKKLDKTALSL